MTISGQSGVALLSSPVRRAIVDYLAAQEDPDVGAPADVGLTAAELSEILSLHVTTARFHLDQLVRGGILDADFVREGVGRPRKVYRLTAGSMQDESDQHGMRILTELLADSFGAAAAGEVLTPFEAGRRWAADHVPAGDTTPATTPGAWLAKIGRLIDVLHIWGYTPHLSTSHAGRSADLELAHCPFIDLAATNPAVVCGIHRGLIAGTLEQFGETDVEVSLEPFVGPQRCVAHLKTASRFGRATPTPTPPHPTTTTTKETA